MTLTIDAEFGHERLLTLTHASGLLVVIAFHSTALGPAVGGMRYRRYESLTAALVDALRLSRAMTLKNAAAGLAWGGGKLCVVDDGDESRRNDRLVALAGILNDLGGSYIVGKDVGATIADMDVLASHSPWVVGMSPALGGLGDPSPATAETVLGSMRAASSLLWGTTSLEGRTASVVGVGGVGGSLARLLAESGMTLLVADTDAARLRHTVDCVGATPVSVGDALVAEVDFLAPCATGEMVDHELVDHLRCDVIAGGANNPLVDDGVAEKLHARGILYVPDFLSNAGGVIQNAVEFARGRADDLEGLLHAADERTYLLLEKALAAGRPPLELARAEALASVHDAEAASGDGASEREHQRTRSSDERHG